MRPTIKGPNMVASSKWRMISRELLLESTLFPFNFSEHVYGFGSEFEPIVYSADHIIYFTVVDNTFLYAFLRSHGFRIHDGLIVNVISSWSF